MECLYSGTPINIITTEIRFSNRIHYSLLQEAVNLVLERDVSLRTRIHLGEDGVPVQYTVPFERETFPHLDFSMTDEEGIHHWASTVSRDPLPLYDSPLYRFIVFRADSNTAGILVRMHHIISDGWTQLMVCNRIGQVYLDLVAGREPDLAEAPPYLNHLEAEKEYFASEEFQTDRDFWASQLAQAGPPTTLKTFKGNLVSPIGKRKRYKLPQTLNHAIYSFCMENRIAPFSVFYIALATYLARITGERTLTLGVPVFNRMSFAFKQTSGMFVSTLPLVFTVDESQTFDEGFKAFGEHWMENLRHQRFPYSEMQKLRTRQGELFQIVLSYQDGTMLQSGASSVRISGNWYYSGYQKEHLCIHMTNIEDNQKYAIDYDYLTQLFTDREIDEIHSHLCHILRSALEYPGKTTNTLLPLNDDLRETVLYTFNRSSKPLHYQRLYELFTGVEARHPNRVALIENGQRISYSSLRFRGGEIASCLDTPGQLVAVLLPKGIPLYAAIVGILQAGCAFVLISPDLPAARISEILDDSGADRIITNSMKYCFAEEFGVPVTNVDQPGDYTPAAASPGKDDLAYVVYTSGSTGKPKGVEITCQNLLNLVNAMRPYYSKDAVLSLCNIEFDAFILESVVPLLLGRTIVIPEKSQLENPKAVANLILGYAVGFLATTPSRLGAYLADPDFQKAVGRLERIICGGESISEDLVAKLRTLTGAHVYNQYGPSETCVAVSIARVSEMGRVTAGKPMDNCRLYVLDKWMQPLPVGVFGDLYVGGLCVGRGYRNNRELTEQKFLPNPYEINDRLYRTGDLASWTSDGEIVLSGRVDKQVKIRGVRIELDDIASCLAGFTGVREAAARVFDIRGQAVILAYYAGEEGIRETDLLRFMGEQLPYYMLPSRIIRLEEMPLTANGKADESRLPFPEEDGEGRAPATRLQESILRIFIQTLGQEDLHVDSDYFLSGGNSLNAMETIARIEDELGPRIRISDLYSLRTAALVAEQLEGSHPGPALAQPPRKPALEKAPKQERYPLSSIQRGIYVQSQMDPTGLLYHMPGAFTVEEPLEAQRLSRAFRDLVAGDEIFRMSFEFDEGELWQIPGTSEGFDVEILEGNAFEDAAASFLRPFNLAEGHLVRLGLWQGESATPTLFFDIHHIISDGLSTPLILSRLSRLYAGNRVRVDYGYQDYLWHIQERETPQRTREYWKERFAAPPHPLELPGDYIRPETPGYRGGLVRTALSKDATTAINEFCADRKLTPYMFFAAVLGILLARYSRQRDLVIGSPVSNRELAEFQEVCGPFLETLPLRLRPAGELAGYLDQVRTAVLELLDHSDIDLETIIHDADLPRTVSGNPLFRVMLSMHPLDSATLSFGSSRTTLREMETATARMDLALDIEETDGQYALTFEYAKDLFDGPTAALLARSFGAASQEVLDGEGRQVEELRAVSPQDWVKYIERPAKRVAPYLRMPLNEIISEQCMLFPEEEAVICNGHSLTFAAFERRARQIAGLLRQNGVMPGDKVGVVLRRNLDLLPALTGVLMAGAAYVPFLDNQPEKRISYMMENACVNVILHDGETGHAIQNLGFLPVDIREHAEPLAEVHPNGMEDTIYVLYTSGSTGLPKGVQLPHRAISNLLECIKEIMVLNTGRVLCTTNMTFDIFITESLLALAQGFTVVLADEHEMVLPYKLAELTEKHDVRVMQYTPSRLNINIQNKKFEHALSMIERVIMVGENMPLSLVNAFKKATNAQIFNMYGPTEAAVYVTQGELFAEEPVTIGRPLNNCRLYVVDENLRVLPPMAKGEICIAGICLADGYISCPDLTDKMFVADAVLPGERMYRSGDIGRLRLDGTYECFGRIDSQIKVNGMRIEPQEIIDAMVEAGAAHAAIYPKKNQDGSVTLYGFVTPADLDCPAIAQRLAGSLPEYMIPRDILALDRIPQNDSGKTDMKRLEQLVSEDVVQMELPVESRIEIPLAPAPEADAEEGTPEPAPEGEPQAGLGSVRDILDIWQKSLGKKTLSADRSYFEQGGTSLGALGIIGQYYNLGYTFTVAEFYQFPTAKAQFQRMTGLSGDVQQQFPTETPAASPRETHPRYVPSVKERNGKQTGRTFLTGGSGFLGAHLLEALLKDGDTEVDCLVRPGRTEAFFETLSGYFGQDWLQDAKARIHPVHGDLTQDFLGLDPEAYRSLAARIQRIYHSAADVRHYCMEHESLEVNLYGTQRILRLARDADAALHHISTVSVAAEHVESAPETPAMFFEMDFDIGQNWKDNVYTKTKFLAEAAVYRAIEEEDLDAHVYRVGRLVGRASDGKFQQNPESNAFYALLRAIGIAGAVPESIAGESLELTPVDECARAIVALGGSLLTTLHLETGHRIPVPEILGDNIRVLPDGAYGAHLMSLPPESKGPELTPLLDYIVESQSGRLKIKVSSVITQNEMAARGIQWSAAEARIVLKEFPPRK